MTNFTRINFSLLSLLISVTTNFAQIDYPAARRVPFDTLIQDIKITDDYFWMSWPQNREEMVEFCRQQAKLSLSILDSIPGMDVLQNELDDVYLSMADEIWNLHPAGEFIYYYRDIPKEGPTLCRRKGLNGEEEKILGRVVIKGQRYSVRKRQFARSRPMVALMLTQNGESNPHIRIFDLDLKEFLPDSIGSVMFNDSRGVSMAWTPGDQSVLYTQAPPTNLHAEKYFNGKVKQHVLGKLSTADAEIFGIGLNPNIELTPKETPYVYSFKNSPYLVARIRSGSGDNYAYAVHHSKLNGPNTPWVRLKNYVNLGDGFDANGKWLYAATNGAPGYRIVKIDMDNGNEPELFLPEQKDVLAVTDDGHRTGIIAGRDVLYVLLRRIGDMQIMKVDLKTKITSLLNVGKNSSIGELIGLGDNDILFLQSTPVKSYQYETYSYIKNNVQPVPFGKRAVDNSGEFSSEVLWVPSRDGKKIPVTVLYLTKAGLKGDHPVLIDAYGNSGASQDMHFNPSWFSWIKRGGVYAYAHVRGGGELGEEWYLDGQFPKKMNSVNDVVDVAEWLETNQYSLSSKMFVMGGSAGTFLVGGAVNQRPDLFAGGIFLSGLPDLATHTDAAGGREEKSVGPKNTKEGFKSNYDMSSIYHVPKGKALPSMLIIHGATDYILALHPAARYAATLQERQLGDRPILFLTDWESGHSGGGADVFHVTKFILWQSGHPDFQLKK